MHDNPPKTKFELIALSPTIALKTYKGEVPMSPKIIPKLIINPTELSLCKLLFAFKIVFILLSKCKDYLTF